MLTLNSPQITQETVLRWREQHARVAFVPTMGALHEGHLALVRKAKTLADKVIVSIFVNPLQFSPAEDFEKYPRPIEEDTTLLLRESVDLLFQPNVDDLYPTGFSTAVRVKKLGDHLCGPLRAGHFEGVATVCTKLFTITQPNFAIFGEKDFQQVRILEQLVADLNLPIAIVRHETLREEDGLALSSRNKYLTGDERAVAALLPQVLFHLKKRSENVWGLTVGEALDHARQALSISLLEEEYLAIASGHDLVPAGESVKILDMREPRVFAAFRIGKTRLIDNMSIEIRQPAK